MLSKTWQNIVICPAILPANLKWIISDFFESSTHTFVASVSLRWRTGPSHHVLGNRGLRNLDAELKQLTVNARRSPERVVSTHRLNQT
jgi:hypothetical protein